MVDEGNLDPEEGTSPVEATRKAFQGNHNLGTLVVLQIVDFVEGSCMDKEAVVESVLGLAGFVVGQSAAAAAAGKVDVVEEVRGDSAAKTVDFEL